MQDFIHNHKLWSTAPLLWPGFGLPDKHEARKQSFEDTGYFATENHNTAFVQLVVIQAKQQNSPNTEKQGGPLALQEKVNQICDNKGFPRNVGDTLHCQLL